MSQSSFQRRRTALLIAFRHAQRSPEALSLSSSIFFGNTRFPSRTCLRLAYSFSVRNLRHHVGIATSHLHVQTHTARLQSFTRKPTPYRP